MIYNHLSGSQAQKIFGNRWTEIAKVVSGRTDNAVKNRFTTLCKKRAKNEALAKENNTTSYINLNNKRVKFPNGLSTDGGAESAAPLKKMRTYISNTPESQEERLAGECGVEDHLLRPPFAILAENAHNSENNKNQGRFLKKDDPKVLALMQPAELLSSLAIKIHLDKTDRSLESVWTALQDFLKQNKESDVLAFRNPDTDIQLEKFKELVEDLRSSNEGSRPSWREHDVYESSPASSEYSTGSTLLSNLPGDKTEDQHCLAEESGMCPTASTNEVNILICNGIKDNNDIVCDYSNAGFDSPVHVTPLFRAVAAAIPSPKFSESEKHFLMKTLGMDSTSPISIVNPSQHRACKRSLLHCL